MRAMPSPTCSTVPTSERSVWTSYCSILVLRIDVISSGRSFKGFLSSGWWSVLFAVVRAARARSRRRAASRPAGRCRRSDPGRPSASRRPDGRTPARCGRRARRRLLLERAEVERFDRLVDQPPLVRRVEHLAGHLRDGEDGQLRDLLPDHGQRASGLGLDLTPRLLEPPLAIGLRLVADALAHRLRVGAHLLADLLRLLPRLRDQRPVLLEQPARLRARVVRLDERLVDALAALVDHLLDRTERPPLEHEQRDQEGDDRPDHQTRRDLDEGVRGDGHYVIRT